MQSGPSISGKTAIIAVLGVAIALTAFAWWYRYQQGDRALAFWGSSTAQLIRHAPKVELLELGAADSNEIEARTSRQVDVSGANGLVHARHSLIVDQNFLWDRPPEMSAVVWDLALRFSNGDDAAVVLLDYDSGAIQLEGRDQATTLVRPIVEGMRDYANRQLAAPAE